MGTVINWRQRILCVKCVWYPRLQHLTDDWWVKGMLISSRIIRLSGRNSHTNIQNWSSYTTTLNWKHVLIRKKNLPVEDAFPAHYIVSYCRVLFNFNCRLFTNRQFVLEGIYSSIHALVRALKVGVAMLKEQVTVLLSKQNTGRQMTPQWSLIL